jgi:AraC-like DNA-binding protein
MYRRCELSDSAYWQLLRAEAYIAEHLQDPGLAAETVAKVIGRSVRQLNRLFEARQSSISQSIWQQRLARAREDLACAQLRSATVGDIAHRWGFASQAHFARAFKARYGLAPTSHRRRAFG